ncbi:RsmB/NOP family class I SAM-dependent RNA methyltransferase [Candidatus Woesearchaeota archaeon]|nr:RsmB/NOP family class I SAM-dependent RNA methyltransferase [Candidatus Woesearchaeota archaeon]
MLNPVPNADNILFKHRFVEQYSKLTDWERFRKYSLSFLRKSIRVNTIKTSAKELIDRMSENWVFEQIPWCSDGFWIEHKEGRIDVGNTIEHALGYYYVQEAASMIPPIVLDVHEHELILDMAAAPGSKTSQMAAMMKNTGIIVANDPDGQRLAALGINLMRCGITSQVITQMNGEGIKGVFDRILLDAPCSGTGTIRKSLKTIQMWNPSSIKRLVKLQLRLINHAFDILKPGGVMVYSTCSLEPVENEEVINTFLNKHPDGELTDIQLEINHSPAITEFEGNKYSSEISRCLRLWPQDNDTEGFFVAKIRKA